MWILFTSPPKCLASNDYAQAACLSCYLLFMLRFFKQLSINYIRKVIMEAFQLLRRKVL